MRPLSSALALLLVTSACGHAPPKAPPPPKPPATAPATQPTSSMAAAPKPPPPPAAPKTVDRGWGKVPTLTADDAATQLASATSGDPGTRDECGGFDKAPPQLLVSVKAPIDHLRVLLVPMPAQSFLWHVSYYSWDLKDADEDFTGCAIGSFPPGLGKKAGVYAIGTLGNDSHAPVKLSVRAFTTATTRDPLKLGAPPAAKLPLAERGLLVAYPELTPQDLEDPAIAKRFLAEAPKELFAFRPVKGGVEPVLLVGDNSQYNVLTPDGLVVEETSLSADATDKVILPTKPRPRAIFDEDAPRFARSAKAKALADAIKDAPKDAKDTPAKQAELVKLVTDEDTTARADVLAAAKARKW